LIITDFRPALQVLLFGKLNLRFASLSSTVKAFSKVSEGFWFAVKARIRHNLLTNFRRKRKIVFIKKLKHKSKRTMKFNRETAVERAKEDLAQRLKVKESDVKTASVKERDFPDMSLGAPASDEMSAQMISTGWSINLSANGKSYEYRADKYQLRLLDFDGTNYVIK